MDSNSIGKSKRGSILNYFKKEFSISPPHNDPSYTNNRNKVLVTQHLLPHIKTKVNKNNKNYEVSLLFILFFK